MVCFLPPKAVIKPEIVTLVVRLSGGDAKIVLLLFNAGPLDITYAKHNSRISAIMECFFPAMAAGDAIYNVLTRASSDAVPAGRLPATWPANLQQVC